MLCTIQPDRIKNKIVNVNFENLSRIGSLKVESCLFNFNFVVSEFGICLFLYVLKEVDCDGEQM